MLKEGKTVIACGLDGNYKRECFGDMGRLISLADDVQKLNAVCLLSNPVQNAPFTRRIVADEKETLVGTDDAYISCSREIFNLDNREFLELYRKYKTITF
jgi:thymidine kinase